MPKNRRILSVLASFCLCASLALAQTETGQITGAVLDQSGAAIAGANLTLRSTKSGAIRNSTSTTTGNYSFTNLLPEEYELTATVPGFTTFKQRAVVTVGSAVALDVRLAIGSETQTVQVTETSTAVNTETQTLSTTVTEKEIQNLPSLTRNPYDFVAIAGNVSNGDGNGRGVGYAINGQRAASTGVLLDGTANNDEFATGAGQKVPLDSVQEYSILTSDFTAEYGRAGGGVVNVVTKSGGNDYHGSAYEYNRVSALSSNSFDNNANGIDKSVFTRNQFGYSVGGPVLPKFRNKLFFFNNVEWTRIRSASTQTAFVPTPQLLAASAANTQGFFNAYGKLASNAQTLQTYSRNDLIALGSDPCKGATLGFCTGLSRSLPLFSKVGYSVPFDAGGGSPQNTYNVVGRIDYNLSDRTQIYGRYALYSEGDSIGTNSNSPYNGYNTGQTLFNNSVLVSMIHSFSARSVWQPKFDFNRFNNQQPLGTAGVVPGLYINPTGSSPLFGTPFALPGYLPFAPGNAVPFGGPQNFFQTYQDFSYTTGNHSIRYGGSYVHLRDNRTFGAYETAVDSLSKSALGPAIDNLLAGQLYRQNVAIYPQGKLPCGPTFRTAPTPDCSINLPATQPNFSRSNRYHEFAFYAQDSWKVTPRFTINIGLRYEYFGVQHNANPNLDANFYDGPVGGYTGPGPQRAPGIASGRELLAPLSPVGGLWKPDYGDFGPRVGFAWDIFGDGKTSFRGGYGLSYERNFGNVTFNAIQNPPNYETVNITNGIDVKSLPISSNNLGFFSGNSGTVGLPPASIRNLDPNIKTAKINSWSAALEHQFANSIVLSASYSGSAGTGLYDIQNLNRAGFGNVYLGIPCTPGACTSYLNPQFTGINRRGDFGFSRYHSLNTKAVVRNLHNTGISLIANYTWSHAIDNLSSTFSEAFQTSNNGAFILGYEDPFFPKRDKGNAEFDLRQRVSISGVWEVPTRHGAGLFNTVLGGWSVAPIFVAQTGSPFSIFDSTNGQNIAPRAAFIGSVPRTGSSSPKSTGAPNSFTYLSFSESQIDRYTNAQYGASDLGAPPSNQSGRDAFYGPGRWNLDLAAYKTTKLSERFSLTIRGEAYNLFNHSNLTAVGSSADLGSQNYVTGQYGFLASGVAERRNLQLAVRLTF